MICLKSLHLDLPQEAQALLDELKAPSFDLEMLARERRLSDYIKFLNTLLQGAEEFNSLKQPPEVDQFPFSFFTRVNLTPSYRYMTGVSSIS